MLVDYGMEMSAVEKKNASHLLVCDCDNVKSILVSPFCVCGGPVFVRMFVFPPVVSTVAPAPTCCSG